MKKIIAFLIAGMFVLIGCVTITIAEQDDDPDRPNRAPRAPVIIQEKSNWDKEEYNCFFYSEDPDGDDVYYEIKWEKIDDIVFSTNEPDDPVKPWLGPFSSGEEINQICICDETGEYQLKIRAKDTNGNIGSYTIITVTYTKTKMMQFPFFTRILERFPVIQSLIIKINNF